MDSKFILPENVEILDQIGDASIKSEPSDLRDEVRPMTTNLNGELKNLTVTVRGQF